MVAVSNATLRHNVFETIYDLVDGISFSGVGTVTVTASFNDKDQKPPVVVVAPVDVQYDAPSFDRSAWDFEIRVLIDIWTKKRERLDKIADQLMNTLNSYSYEGFHLVGVDEDTAQEVLNNNKYHLKSIALTFTRR